MKGFVLINTIYIISLIALMVLTLQNSTQLDGKIINSLTIFHNELRNLEKTAIKLINDMSLNSQTDKISVNNKQDFINYDDVVIQGHEAYKSKIYYTITDLGEFVCLRNLVDSKSFGTHHYLLKIVNKNLPSKILQIRYSLIGSDAKCDGSVYRYIPLGIISWNLK